MKKLLIFVIITSILTGFFTGTICAQNPTYTLDLRNDVQVSGTVYEFDIYLLRTGTTPFEYASGQYGITLNPLIRNSGSIIPSIVAGSSDPILVTSNQTPATISFFEPTSVIRISASSPPGAGKGALIPNVYPGTRICRVRLTNTVEFAQYQPNLMWTTSTIYPTQIYAYVGGSNIPITTYSNHTTSNLVNPVLNLPSSIENTDYDGLGLEVNPNPFNETLDIKYNLLDKSQVELSVYNLNGKLVRQLINEEQPAGSYTCTWNSASQPEGIYVVKLHAGIILRTSRVLLVH